MPSIGHASITFVDRQGKASVQRLNCLVQAVGNIAAQDTAFNTLVADTVALSLGTNTRSEIGNSNFAANPALPTSNNALRSNKFAVSYHDKTTGDRYTTQIPVANFAGVLMLPGTKLVDMVTAGPAATYKTDFEAFVKSEEGNDVQIDFMRAIGRHI